MSLTQHRMNLQGKTAKFYQLANVSNVPNKNTAHFYGGNGFAVGVYEPFLAALSAHYNISSLAMQGCWYDKPTATKLTREQDANLLIDYLQQTQNKPVVGIGHSMGATATAMAAAKRPDLFSALYFLEPVSFTRWQAKLYERIPKWIKARQEPFKSTNQKHAYWDSIDDYYQHLRTHKAYKRMSDDNLYTYAKNSLDSKTQTGYPLIFSPEQELANYYGSTPFIDDALIELNKIDLPYTLIIGKPSIFISDKVRKNWQNFVPARQIITLPEYGHLLPLEAPQQCAKLIAP